MTEDALKACPSVGVPQASRLTGVFLPLTQFTGFRTAEGLAAPAFA